MQKMPYIFVISLLAILPACNKPAEQSAKPPTNAVEVTAPKITPELQPAAVNIDGKFCFVKHFKQDVTTINLVLAGTKVSGDMRWAPYQKDGTVGTLAGEKLPNGELQLVYDYMIEGNQQTETKIMKMESDVLWVKIGELEDPKFDGNLRYKDASKAVYTESLEKIACK